MHSQHGRSTSMKQGAIKKITRDKEDSGTREWENIRCQSSGNHKVFIPVYIAVSLWQSQDRTKKRNSNGKNYEGGTSLLINSYLQDSRSQKENAHLTGSFSGLNMGSPKTFSQRNTLAYSEKEIQVTATAAGDTWSYRYFTRNVFPRTL